MGHPPSLGLPPYNGRWGGGIDVVIIAAHSLHIIIIIKCCNNIFGCYSEIMRRQAIKRKTPKRMPRLITNNNRELLSGRGEIQRRLANQEVAFVERRGKTTLGGLIIVDHKTNTMLDDRCRNQRDTQIIGEILNLSKLLGWVMIAIVLELANYRQFFCDVEGASVAKIKS